MSDTTARVKAIIIDKLGVDENEVTLEASFTNDLGADSLDTVELIMEFEKEFNIAIPDDQAEKIGTVGEAVSLNGQAGSILDLHPDHSARRGVHIQFQDVSLEGQKRGDELAPGKVSVDRDEAILSDLMTLDQEDVLFGQEGFFRDHAIFPVIVSVAPVGAMEVVRITTVEIEFTLRPRYDAVHHVDGGTVIFVAESEVDEGLALIPVPVDPVAAGGKTDINTSGIHG